MATLGTNNPGSLGGHQHAQPLAPHQNHLHGMGSANRQQQQVASANVPSKSSQRAINIIVDDVVEDHSTRINSGIIKRYRRGNLLGRGGFAKCFHLTSLDTNREYAGKFISKESMLNASSKAKIQMEVKLHRSINHKNIVKFERYFEDGRNLVMLLELCRQKTLLDLSKTRGTLTETEAQYFLWQIVEVVHALHSHNIIHRDLKLGNIFLDDGMLIKVGDFGLATRIESLDEKKKTICGTPNYIAPEIIADRGGQGHSFEVDVWAIGVIAYTMLYGKPPFETQSVKETYEKIKGTNYMFPENPHISPAARSFIGSMLIANPLERATLHELRNHAFFTQSPFPVELPVSIRTTPYYFTHRYISQIQNSPYCPVNFTAQQMIPLEKEPNALKPVVPQQIKPQQQQQQQQPQQQQYMMNKENENIMTKPYTSLTASATSATTTNSMLYKQPMKPLTTTTTKPPALGTFAANNLVANNLTNANASNLPPVPKLTIPNVPISTSTSANDEMTSLTSQMQQLNLKKNEDTTASRNLWVNLWVDYSQKYGLGYLLSNGSCGVYFNDGTKMVLHANMRDVQYLDKNHENVEVIEHFSLDSPPSHLNKKKVQLHEFLQYLLVQNKSNAPAPGNDDYINFTTEFDAANAHSSMMEHVRWWIRTEHATAFRLASKLVQVIFNDDTELMLNQEQELVVYTDKYRQRHTHKFNEIQGLNRPDLVKRMKYAWKLVSHNSTVKK